jgi:hypothetical protein
VDILYLSGMVNKILKAHTLKKLLELLGFVRYPSLSEGAGAMMSGEARDERFNVTRDICSSFFNDDKTRRSQTNAMFFSAPFTIINHAAAFVASGCLRVFEIRGRKKINTVGDGPDVNRAHFVDEDRDNEVTDDNSALSQTLGFVVGNIVVLIFWVAGGVLSMTFAALNLWVNQSLYNSLLLRRSFRGFVLSLVVGDIFLINGERSDSSLEAGILELDQEIRVETQKNQLKTKEYGIQNGTESINDDVEQSENKLSRPELRELTPMNKLDQHENRKLKANRRGGADLAAAHTIPHGEIAISEDVTTRITIVAHCNTSNVCLNKIEPKDEESDEVGAVPIRATGTAQDLQAKTTNDQTLANANSNYICRDTSGVVFGVDDEPGTQAWREVIKTSTQAFPCKKYSPGIHKWILHKLQDKKFYVKTSTHSQRRASRWEVKRRCKACFEKEMKNLAQVQTLLGEVRHQQDHEEHEGIPLHGYYGKQRKGHMATKLYTREFPSSTENVEIDIASKGRSLESVRASTKTEEAPSPSDMIVSGVSGRRVIDVYFEDENHPGTLTWRQAVKDARQEYTGKSYSSHAHKWMLKKLKGSRFYVKTRSGPWRRAFAWEVERRCRRCFLIQTEQSEQIQVLMDELLDQLDPHSNISSTRRTENGRVSALNDAEKQTQVVMPMRKMTKRKKETESSVNQEIKKSSVSFCSLANNTVDSSTASEQREERTQSSAIKREGNDSREGDDECPTESKGPNETLNDQSDTPGQAVPMSQEANACGLELPPLLAHIQKKIIEEYYFCEAYPLPETGCWDCGATPYIQPTHVPRAGDIIESDDGSCMSSISDNWQGPWERCDQGVFEYQGSGALRET